ncbi:hypothetical protein CANARDRAFT_27962 [[Candida] arabinofermentans NRRL YB-2248]|uniref:PH domain-like protein n=1 Tax=[Candida] arabinofermentans NRRL YB-2248 TaxID=983967 RepID=A0A1E4T2B0_9ASCO|nr:hypothetical protein CANARDRAFT_27962 [[Candida] arabinofermentans NRRL YB-2248]
MSQEKTKKNSKSNKNKNKDVGPTSSSSASSPSSPNTSGTVSMNAEAQTNNNDQEKQTWEIYKNTLTFNVVAKYDPRINQFVHLTSYCVVYKFDEALNDWSKLDYQGPLIVYSRNCIASEPNSLKVSDVLSNDKLYQYGLMVLNRSKPENFSIGLLATKYLVEEDKEEWGLIVEKNEKLIIVRDFKGDTFGLWIFADEDRDYMSEILKFCIES